jgi:hypothetical protein
MKLTDKEGSYQEEVILHDPELVERIFELRMTIAESTSLTELNDIKEALKRDLQNEVTKLAGMFKNQQGDTRMVIHRARYL